MRPTSVGKSGIDEGHRVSGASAGHRARVEEKHDRPCAEHLAEPTRMAGFVREFEVRSAVAASFGLAD